MTQPLYFGRWGAPGHHLNTRSGHMARPEDGLRVRDLDGDPGPYLPVTYEDRRHQEAPQGVARLTYERHLNLTILAFWDRSADHRPGSHSTFVLPGELGYESALLTAREAFPEVWERIDAAFAVRQG